MPADVYCTRERSDPERKERKKEGPKKLRKTKVLWLRRKTHRRGWMEGLGDARALEDTYSETGRQTTRPKQRDRYSKVDR